MAALDPANTGRFWLDYTDGHNEHTLMVRYGESATLADVMFSIDLFLTDLSTHLYVLTITGARYSGEGSHVSSPVVWTGAAAYGSGAMPLAFRPKQWCWLGRTTGGRRARWFLFGVSTNVPDNYRELSGSGNAAQDGTTGILAGQALGVFIAIDKLTPQLANYADVNFNNYWERRSR